MTFYTLHLILTLPVVQAMPQANPTRGIVSTETVVVREIPRLATDREPGLKRVVNITTMTPEGAATQTKQVPIR